MGPGRITTALFCVIAVALCPGLAGCSKKDGEPSGQSAEPTAAPQEQPATEPARLPSPDETSATNGMTSISDNLKFFSAAEIAPTTPATKDLDSVIRPVLTELFGGAKLVVETGREGDDPLRKDTLNTMTYVVRRLLDTPAGDELHAALKAARFSVSPRYGAKPVHGRTTVLMSFFKTTAVGRYSLGIRLDLIQQTIHVENFELGSKYDRL